MDNEQKTIVGCSAEVDRQWADLVDFANNAAYQELKELRTMLALHDYPGVRAAISKSDNVVWLICKLSNAAFNEISVRLMRRIADDHQPCEPGDNPDISQSEIMKIRSLADFDMEMLLGEINDHGWNMARRTLAMMPPNPESPNPT